MKGKYLLRTTIAIIILLCISASFSYATSTINSLKLNRTTVSLNVGSKITLEPIIKPDTATTGVKWKSSNTKIVKVSSKGVVSAAKKGSATVTATANDGSGLKAKCKVTVGNSDTFTMTSRITGKKISAKKGKSVSVYSLKRYNVSSDSILPYPPTWSEKKWKQTKMEEWTDTNGYSYNFSVKSSASTDAKARTLRTQLLNGYMDKLVSMGFSRKDVKPTIGNIKYCFSKNGKDGIWIKESGNYEIVMFVPTGFDFDLGGSGYKKTISVAAKYMTENYTANTTKDCFTVTGFDKSDNGGVFNLFFEPGQYKCGDRFVLRDYLKYTNVSTDNALLYATFLGKEIGENRYSTNSHLTANLDTSTYLNFKKLEVDVLKKTKKNTVIYYYVEVDAGIGATHKLEGIINAKQREASHNA